MVEDASDKEKPTPPFLLVANISAVHVFHMPLVLLRQWALIEPHVRHLRGPLREMRMRGRDGKSRALYVAAKGRRVVIVRVFLKKTQTTPGREIDLALSRAKEALS